MNYASAGDDGSTPEIYTSGSSGPYKQYTVRLQAQGGGLEKSVVLGNIRPVSVTEGLVGLEGLKIQLNKNQLKERRDQFVTGLSDP